MQKAPQPIDGRVYSLVVDHGAVVYVTKNELALADFILDDVLVIGMLLFGTAFFLKLRYPSDFA